MHSTEVVQAPAELTLAEVLSGAVQLHRHGHIDEAEELYRRVLEVDPDQPDALGFLGIVAMHRGRIDEAIELIERALTIEPGNADRYNNLGNVLLAAERVDDALEAYRKSIELDPRHADAYNNLGVIYKAQRRFEESGRAYERAIEIDASHIEAYNNYGNLLSAQGRVADAIKQYSKALILRPHDANARKYMAMAHAALGELDAAAAIYREWLEQDPDHPGVKHLLAACSGENVPERATDAYIETTFDIFSMSFDAKLAKLEYRAPELVAEALARVEPNPRKSLAVLLRYADTIAPAVDVGWLTGDVGANLLKILNWANDPAIRSADARARRFTSRSAPSRSGAGCARRSRRAARARRRGSRAPGGTRRGVRGAAFGRRTPRRSPLRGRATQR